MASWLYFLRKVAALSTEGRERLEIGGASGHSHSGAGLSSDWGQAAIAKSATGLPSKRCPKLEPNLPLSLLGAAPFRPGLACRQPHHSGRPRLLFIRGPCAKGRYSRPIPIRVRAAGSQRSRRSPGSSQCRHRRSPASREVGLFGFRPWAVAVSKFQTDPSDTGRSWIRLSHELVSVEQTLMGKLLPDEGFPTALIPWRLM